MSRYTVDELAQASGLNTSTIRLYRQRGLLPGPAMTGRVGYFDEGHLARLKLVGELRDRGFSLAGIKQLVDSWEAGRDLGAVLGLERSLVQSVEMQPMTREALADRFPELRVDARLWDRLIAASIVTLDGDDEIAVPSRFLGIAGALQAFGVPLAVMLDEFDPVWAFARTTAARFVALFERHVMSGAVALDPGALASMITALRDAGTEVVAGTLSRAIDEAAADAVARYAADGAAASTAVN